MAFDKASTPKRARTSFRDKNKLGLTRNGKNALSYLRKRFGKATTRQQIATAIEVEVRTVSRCISELEGMGYIKVTREGIGSPCVFERGGRL